MRPPASEFGNRTHGAEKIGPGRYSDFFFTFKTTLTGITNLCQFTRSVPISMKMDGDVPSLDQLGSNAAECIGLAEAARTSEHKSLFIEMAERWLTLAEHAAREGRLNGEAALDVVDLADLKHRAVEPS